MYFVIGNFGQPFENYRCSQNFWVAFSMINVLGDSLKKNSSGHPGSNALL
jgi:hypothetical protein